VLEASAVSQARLAPLLQCKVCPLPMTREEAE